MRTSIIFLYFYDPASVHDDGWGCFFGGIFSMQCIDFICCILGQLRREHIWWKLNLCENPCKSWQKNSSKFKKKIIHVDDMMIHNLVKYLVQTQLHLWDIKITNFLKFVRNLLFLYLTNEVEFGHNILWGCVLSYHLHVWFFS